MFADIHPDAAVTRGGGRRWESPKDTTGTSSSSPERCSAWSLCKGACEATVVHTQVCPTIHGKTPVWQLTNFATGPDKVDSTTTYLYL